MSELVCPVGRWFTPWLLAVASNLIAEKEEKLEKEEDVWLAKFTKPKPACFAVILYPQGWEDTCQLQRHSLTCHTMEDLSHQFSLIDLIGTFERCIANALSLWNALKSKGKKWTLPRKYSALFTVFPQYVYERHIKDMRHL